MDLQKQAAEIFNLTFTDLQMDQFNQLAQDLVSWNRQMNLTAITKHDEILVRHILDSLSVAAYVSIQPGMRLMDVGTGAGFPGLPLAILAPALHITLMEATGKKLKFINHVIDVLNLTNASTLHARAEDAGKQPQHREQYDLVTARAVARLPALLEYLLPLAKVGGYCVALKGETAHDEVNQSGKALQVLGGALRGIKAVQLPQVEHTHYLVIVEKMKPTPPEYPRNPGTPTRKPL